MTKPPGKIANGRTNTRSARPANLLTAPHSGSSRRLLVLSAVSPRLFRRAQCFFMDSERPVLVVLGTGFGAVSLIKDIDVERFDVRVVSPRNHFLFTPLLPSTTVGTLEFRSIIEPIRKARKGIKFHQALCTRIRHEDNVIECAGAFKGNPFELKYDYLVIAVGAVSNTFGIPGVNEHAFLLKELSDARAIRQRIGECFERAYKPGRTQDEIRGLLHFVVVGGGPTGVEFAAELHDFVTQDVRRWYPDMQQHVRITLLEAKGEILTQFDAKLGAYAQRHFSRMRVEIRTESMVKEVLEDRVILSSGEQIPCGLVVWSTGIGPTQLVADLPFHKDPMKRLLVDEHFLVLGARNIYAVGDCAGVQGQDHPPTAQVAQQEGAYLAKNLNRMVRRKDVRPFEYRHMGMLAYIGERRALADLKNVKGKGFATWLFWRSAYVTKLMSFKSKLLVVQDWLRTFLFGRDISHF